MVCYKKGGESLSNNQALVSEEGLTVEARLLHGNAAKNIISLASAERCALIIIGNRGKTEAETFPLGSNSEKVSRRSECSVLIAKEKTRNSNILVAIDGSEYAKKTLQYAVQLRQKLNVEVTSMHVIEGQLLGLNPYPSQNIGRRILFEAVKGAKTVSATRK